jgi:hypothetical protein
MSFYAAPYSFLVIASTGALGACGVSTTVIDVSPLQGSATKPCEDWINFVEHSVMSNLGGMGPDIDSNRELRFLGAGKVGASRAAFDLTFQNKTAYHPKIPSFNRVSGRIARMNIHIGSMVKLEGTFVNAGTSSPVTPHSAKLTFCDIDHYRAKQEEQLVLSNISAFYVAANGPDFSYEVAQASGLAMEENVIHTQVAGRKARKITVAGGARFGVTVTSTKFGQACDDPRDPDLLANVTCPSSSARTVDQAKRCFMVEFENTSSFEMLASIPGAGQGDWSRNFAMAGTSRYFAADTSSACENPVPSMESATQTKVDKAPRKRRPLRARRRRRRKSDAVHGEHDAGEGDGEGEAFQPFGADVQGGDREAIHAVVHQAASEAPAASKADVAPHPRAEGRQREVIRGIPPSEANAPSTTVVFRPEEKTASEARPVRPPSKAHEKKMKPVRMTATGDPHMVNIHGERFDIMTPGKHVLIQIPRWTQRKTMLRVDALVKQVGGACADMYFQSVNLTGRWVDVRVKGGLRFRVGEDGLPSRNVKPSWMRFGDLELKVVKGHTIQGVEYLNIFVKNLRHSSYPVGGLLGEDDHTSAATPNSACRRHVNI